MRVRRDTRRSTADVDGSAVALGRPNRRFAPRRALGARRLLTGLALLAGLLFGLPTAAQTDDGGDQLVVGVYAPHMYFANSLERGQYAEQLAAALGRVTGLNLRGRGYSTQQQFNAQVASGQLHFAVIDAQHQLEKGYTPLAQGTSNGRPTRPMVLVAAGGGTVSGLKGKSLARVQVGPGDAGFVINFLLQNQVDPSFFGPPRTVRDVQGALSLVKLGKADAAFAYKGIEGGIFQSRPVPLPVFVRTGRDIPEDVERKIKQAVLGITIRTRVIEGFTTYRSDVHAALRRALRSTPTGPGNRPVLSRGRDLPGVTGELALGERPAARLPPVADELPVLPPPADLY